MKHVACISNSVNAVECEMKVFFTVSFYSVVEFNRSGLDHNEKDGGCIFYQNAMRSEIISKIKSSLLKDKHKKGGYFFVLLKFYVLRCFS